MIRPSLREVCHSVFSPDALQLCVPPDHRAVIWPQIFYNLRCMRSTTFPRLSVPFSTVQRCRLSFPSLYYCANHTRRFPDVVRSVWNRSTIQTNLQLSICRFPNLLRSISTDYPCVFHTLTPSETRSKTKFVQHAFPKHLDAVVHLQSSPWSIFCRLLRMLRRFLCTCKLPPTDSHKQIQATS